MSSSTPRGWPRSGCGRTSGRPERCRAGGRRAQPGRRGAHLHAGAGWRSRSTTRPRSTVSCTSGCSWCDSARGHTRCSSGPFPKGRSTRSVEAPFCRGGCRLDAINLGGPATSRIGLNGVIRVTGISVDGQTAGRWDRGRGLGRGPRCVGRRDGPQRAVRGRAISVDVGSGESDAVVQLTAGALTGGLPVVRGVDAPAGPTEEVPSARPAPRSSRRGQRSWGRACRSWVRAGP